VIEWSIRVFLRTVSRGGRRRRIWRFWRWSSSISSMAFNALGTLLADGLN